MIFKNKSDFFLYRRNPATPLSLLSQLETKK